MAVKRKAPEKPLPPLKEWESQYPEYPDLIGSGELDDPDAIIQAFLDNDDRSAHELFHAAMLRKFCNQVIANEPVDRWILGVLTDTFHYILRGAAWEERLHLPGREMPPEWGPYSPKDNRNLQIFCDAENMRRDGVEITKALEQVAADRNVSFETARAAYYEWRKRLPDMVSKFRAEDQKDNQQEGS